jgi:hypothetical protein
MAYPTVSAPYGLRPINLIGGRVFAGSTRLIPITSAEGTSIFYGDVVKLNTSGTLTKDTRIPARIKRSTPSTFRLAPLLRTFRLMSVTITSS